MKQKEKKRLVLGFAALLIVALLLDIADRTGEDRTELPRGEFGQGGESVLLYLEIEGEEERYPYYLELEAARPTREQAETYFAEVITQIQDEFREISDAVPYQDSYRDGTIEAEWSFYPRGVVYADGTIEWERIPEEGCNISASVNLQCGSYEKLHEFDFVIFPKEYSRKEKLLQIIETQIAAELQKEGSDRLLLPEEVDGVRLTWTREQESLSLKIILLELLALVAIWYAGKQRAQQQERRLRQDMEMEYPEIVGQLTLLLGAGMTIRQAWNRISARYLDKRRNNQIKKNPAYEAILVMNRQLKEGENERIAYQNFAETTKVMSYYRLVRLLIGNLEKGTGGLCEALEQENRQAYEMRILRAKTLGEEASTKMLLPLILMMLVVMAIVMVPAMLGFST